ncbi:hypothetical protein PFICI_13095 [Pestalotiopsis fici W106-1]|uniref:Uncharacterized protein n=1 Tax=Pestalotiopsis fici (strain W106-1 / CGMCC3.15140) TaxID=1229662 RepID=W3WP71_PESFW|nr:uncharacterized protein PFICI_13095 [Pestalotiopsis fici W106-1]ETS74611.1 hypothetical protein PFICI_13095 [Pestalotiopsis fici W106-1]
MVRSSFGLQWGRILWTPLVRAHRGKPSALATALPRYNSSSSSTDRQARTLKLLRRLSMPSKDSDIQDYEDYETLSVLDESIRRATIQVIGRNGLDILDRLDGSMVHEDHLIATGGLCLEAYCEYIGALSLAHAEAVVRKDRAGPRVWRWLQQPIVQDQIKSNHRNNESLLPYLAAVLVGAGHWSLLESWLVSCWRAHVTPISASSALVRNSDYNRQRKEAFLQFKWGGQFLSGAFNALLWWSPDGSADSVYTNFVRFCKDHGLDQDGARENILLEFPIVPSWVAIGKMAHKGVPASGIAFDELMEMFEILLPGNSSAWPRSSLYLVHPEVPSADPVLKLLKDVASDPNHKLYGFWGTKKWIKVAKFRQRVCFEAADRLRKQGRAADAQWVHDFMTLHWDTGFLTKNGTADPRRGRR